MLQSSSRPYVCWRCISRTRQQWGVTLQQASERRVGLGWSGSSSSHKYRKESFASTLSSPAPAPAKSVEALRLPNRKRHPNSNATKKPGTPIRERLRRWASENEEVLKKVDVTSHGDTTLSGKSANTSTRPQSTVSSVMESIGHTEAGMSALLEQRGLSKHDFEVGVDSRQPGDLVELRSNGSRTPVFAVYLGFFGGRHHFYGSQGRWVMSMGFGSLFTVSNFVGVHGIQPILDEMPKCASAEQFDQARQDDQGPSRAAAIHVIEKMTRFKADAERIYLQNMDKLDRARSLLSESTRIKYLSLFEISDLLLPSSLKEDGSFPAYALYAVHTALYRDEIAFRPLSPTSDCHRRDHLFEIFPHSFMQIINRVATMVRNYWVTTGQMSDPSSERALDRTPFGSFVSKARQVVLSNRRRRGLREGGYLTPLVEPTVMPQAEWSQSSWEIISYLQWWASFDLFEPSSRFSAYGSVILRALDLYEDLPLDQSAAWTFLQEAGLVPMWEIPSRYRVRFPETGIVKGGGLARTTSLNVEESIRPDFAASHRINRTNECVFCIDGPEAVMIDDGISLEYTEKKDEFWIHVHAADPASGIDPHSELAKFMEFIPENIYLQGHFQAMLSGPAGGGPQGAIQDLVNEYSLAPGSRALTFSAKVNMSGDMLDYKVEATRIGDVVYMDPKDVSAFCNEARPPPGPYHELSVGTAPEEEAVELNRGMKTTADLDQSGRDALLTLYRLAEALKKKRLQKGAWPYFFPGPSVQVRFQQMKSENDGSATPAPSSGWVPPDPYIKVSNEEDSNCSVVGNLMVLAGQVAARWCAKREIPVPYRKDSKSAMNFAKTLSYVNNVVYPQIHRGIEPSPEQRSQLSVLTGSIHVSTTPGPHFLMGLDMYAKATSPLRRFSDLLVHWQVHAALAHEHVGGVHTSPEDVDEVLPFSREELTNRVALLHMREKMARTVSRGDRDWILMALARAWKFEGTAPKTFRFTVTSRWRPGLLGYIDLFKLNAMMDVDAMGGQVLVKDVKVGDEFDVELEDVIVHSGEIRVKALKYHPSIKNDAHPLEQVAAA